MCQVEHDQVGQQSASANRGDHFARRYLEMHEVGAQFVELEKNSPADSILRAAREQNSDVILMGGYSKSPMVELVIGSSVDGVLRESDKPMLICR